MSKVESLLEELDTEDTTCRKGLHDYQAYSLNYKKHYLQHELGIRAIILQRNKLGSQFVAGLNNVLMNDKYIKSIDLSGNKIDEHSMSMLIKRSLKQNTTLTNLDCRVNAGCTPNNQKNLALVLVKNIEWLKKSGFTIKDKYINSASIMHEKT